MINRLGPWCVALALLCPSHARAAISFVPTSAGATVPLPGFITTADFNRDGHADVALSSPQAGAVAVLLGGPDGTLSGNLTYPVGQLLGDLAARDINGDQIPDIAVADQRSQGVHVLIGAGDGTFAAPVLVSAGRTAVAVEIADLDGANGADLIVADKSENRVVIRMNGGQVPLAFTDGGQYEVGRGPQQVVLGDFNGDAVPDIVTLNTGGNRVKDVSVLLFVRVAGGLPVFENLADFSVGEDPQEVEAGDFNGDEQVDLALLNVPGGGDVAFVDLLFGQGNGFLVSGPSLALQCPVFTSGLTCRSRAFAAGDFDRDGILDLAVTQIDPRAGTTDDWLTVYRGSGDGTFLPGPVLGAAAVPILAAVADVTGDGALDVIVASDRTRSVGVLVNTSAGGSGDRIPGQSCDADAQCVTGLCRDTVCCRTACRDNERCNLANSLGTCTPQGQQRPRGERCDGAAQCASGFCVDQVCCIAATCPSGARCDVPAAAGVCAAPADVGQICEIAAQCRSGFCVDSFCCVDSCTAGRCDAPGREGTCTGSLPDGQPCTANAQCTSGICDVTAAVCCAQRCIQSEQCSIDGARCAPAGGPTATPSATAPPAPTATPPNRCAGDCDGSQSVAVSELVTGVNIALDRTPVETCAAFDTSGDGTVGVSELVAAVANALRGCPAPAVSDR